MSEMPQETQTRLDRIWNAYKEAIGTAADRKSIPRTNLPMFRPHNLFLGFDSQNVHVVISEANAMPGMSYVKKADLSNHGTVSRRAVLEACRRDLSYGRMSYVTIPLTIMNNSDDESMRAAIKEIAEQNLDRAIRRSSESRTRIF